MLQLSGEQFNQEGERILPAARTRYVVAKYLTMFGVLLCGAAAIISTEHKSMYMGIMLLCMSFGVFNEAIALRIKKENKAMEVTSYIIGALVFVVAWLILLGLLNGL